MISGILQFEFLQNAFLTGIIIGAIAPLVGVFCRGKADVDDFRCAKSCSACWDSV